MDLERLSKLAGISQEQLDELADIDSLMKKATAAIQGATGANAAKDNAQAQPAKKAAAKDANIASYMSDLSDHIAAWSAHMKGKDPKVEQYLQNISKAVGELNSHLTGAEKQGEKQ